MPSAPPELSISIVSHGQSALVAALLNDIAAHCAKLRLEVLLTLNLPEALPFEIARFPFPVVLIENAAPLGFGANHNQAFARASADFFCVLNPDIRFAADPFAPLLAALTDATLGVAAPRVVGLSGLQEDSARRFPSPWSIGLKALGLGRGDPLAIDGEAIYPDWVAGMCMLFPSRVFQAVAGFDTRYFMYYEDVDICARLRLAAYRVVATPAATVVHAAQRASHRQWRHLSWHLRSMLRFFCSGVYWKARAA